MLSFVDTMKQSGTLVPESAVLTESVDYFLP